jgi:hypothetical protein
VIILWHFLTCFQHFKFFKGNFFVDKVGWRKDKVNAKEERKLKIDVEKFRVTGLGEFSANGRSLPWADL